MTTVQQNSPGTQTPATSHRANALAERLEQGARALAALASTLTTSNGTRRSLTTAGRLAS